MSLYALLIFAAVYMLAVATPGPGVAAIVARSLARGTQGAPFFIAGFLIGDLVWFTAAALGLSAIAKTGFAIFAILKYAGAAYLLFLAYKFWTTPAKAISTDAVEPAQSRSSLFLGSLALTLGNPKTMLFFLALLPTVVNLATLTVAGFFEIMAVIVIVLPSILGGYVYLAAKARPLFKSARAMRAINRGSGAAIAGAAIVVATR
jgi:threonine/homoserine/homoserine lactone efflux protein